MARDTEDETSGATVQIRSRKIGQRPTKAINWEQVNNFMIFALETAEELHSTTQLAHPQCQCVAASGVNQTAKHITQTSHEQAGVCSTSTD